MSLIYLTIPLLSLVSLCISSEFSFEEIYSTSASFHTTQVEDCAFQAGSTEFMSVSSSGVASYSIVDLTVTQKYFELPSEAPT